MCVCVCVCVCVYTTLFNALVLTIDPSPPLPLPTADRWQAALEGKDDAGAASKAVSAAAGGTETAAGGSAGAAAVEGGASATGGTTPVAVSTGPRPSEALLSAAQEQIDSSIKKLKNVESSAKAIVLASRTLKSSLDGLATSMRAWTVYETQDVRFLRENGAAQVMSDPI